MLEINRPRTWLAKRRSCRKRKFKFSAPLIIIIIIISSQHRPRRRRKPIGR